MAAATVLLWWRRRGRLPWGRLLLLVAGAAMAASAVRLLAVGAVLLAPLLAEAVQVRATHGDGSRSRRAEMVAWGAAALAVGTIGGWLAVATPHPQPVSRPVSAAMSALPRDAPIAVDAAVMGWAEWAHPSLRPLRDLRSELYDVRTAAAYDAFLRGEPGWEDYATSHRLEAVLVADGSPLGARLAPAGWTKAASDAAYTLWLAPRPDL